MAVNWSYRLSGSWAPLFDMIPLVVRKIIFYTKKVILISPEFQPQTRYAPSLELRSIIYLIRPTPLGSDHQVTSSKVFNQNWGLVFKVML